MSFFSTDVIAKEQLHGVVGHTTAVAPTPAVVPEGDAWATRPRPTFPLYLLVLLGKYLRSKTKQDG